MKTLKKKKTITITDVAQEAGISTATVSRALNGIGYTSPKAYEAAQKAAMRLGYAPNPHARHLSQGRSHNTVALFSLGLDLGAGSQRLSLMQSRLLAKGYDVPIYAHSSSSADHAQWQNELLASICRSRPVAIVYHYAIISRAVAEILEEYQKDGGVVITCPVPVNLECDQVVFDYRDAGYKAGKVLLEAGHRAIGFHLAVPVENQNGYFAGFQQVMQEYVAPVRKQWLFTGMGEWYEAGGAAVAAEILALKNRPTAVCLENDVVASACINELIRAGIRVPEDISVVGQDNTAAAPHCIVPLTTVEQPLETIADQVVEALLSRIRKQYEGEARRMVIQGKLVERSSVAPPVKTA